MHSTLSALGSYIRLRLVQCTHACTLQCAGTSHVSLQKCIFLWGIWAPSTWTLGADSCGPLDPHESAPKRHVDRFCTAHSCAKHTDTQSTLRATSVAIGFIYALRAGDVADLSNSCSNRWTGRWIIRRIFTWELEQLTINNWRSIMTMTSIKKYTRLAKTHF